MNARANFTRMQDSTQADWQVIGGEFMAFAQNLGPRVLSHLKILKGDYGGFPVDPYTQPHQKPTPALRAGPRAGPRPPPPRPDASQRGARGGRARGVAPPETARRRATARAR